MPIQVKTRKGVPAEKREALEAWASSTPGKHGQLTITSTYVLWRPESEDARIKRQANEGVGGSPPSAP